MEKISVDTKKKREVIDITEEVNRSLDNLGAKDGVISLFVMHTTSALTVVELEAGNGPDLLAATQAMVPKLKYSHSSEVGHVGAHIMSALVGSSISLPVESGNLSLGTWQRVALVEFDGPRERHINITFMSNG